MCLMLLLSQLGSSMEVNESEAPSQCRKRLVSLLVTIVVQHALLVRKLEIVRAQRTTY